MSPRSRGAMRPLGDETAGDIGLIWVWRERKYFSKWGWTLESPNSSFRTSRAINNSPQDWRMTIPFKTIRSRAERRKGGAKALQELLPPKPNPKALTKLGDDHVLAEMTRRAFSAGFAWSVIEAKWAGFEEAFLEFEPGRLSLEPDEFWDALIKDTRIVRNGAKIMSVRANAGFVREGAKKAVSFGMLL